MPQPEGHLPQVVKKKEGLMPELRKRRSRLAVLGAFAMVASVLAVGASPASATPGRVDGAAVYSACVGPATADAGFTDVAAGSTHDAAINCIAYYGITRGTSATTFSPNRTIPRWQLAVMLQRAAGPAGATLGAAADQGFTDISDLSSSFRAAINQMAALGVMAGTTATTFDPNGAVSRATIVEALAGFLTSARVGPGGKALARNVDRSLTLRDLSMPRASQVITIDENFRDVGGVTYSEYQAIRALAEMGVVSGRGDGTFGPAASVTRGQAASFITRALAHTNARPAGLTVQASKSAVVAADSLSLSVSVRGNDFSPRGSVSVDAFSYLTENAAMAFKPDGTCQTAGRHRVAVAGNGTVACVVEVDDHETEPSGNVMVDVDTPARATTYWVWTGVVGDKLDWDEANLSVDNSVVSDAASVSVTVSTAPSTAKVTTSVSADADNGNTARYGDTVTVTIQLVDSSGKPVGVSGQSYQWWATGVHAPTFPGRAIPGTGTSTVTTGADGSVSFTLTEADPDPNPDVDLPGEDLNANDSTTWTYYVARVGTAPILQTTRFDDDNNIFTAGSGGAQGSGTLIFDDNQSVPRKLSVELARRWTPRPTTAGTTGRVGVTAKVTDQYGGPTGDVPVWFDLANNTDSATDFGCSGRSSTTPYTCTGTDENVGDPTTQYPGGGYLTPGGTVRRLTRSNGTNTYSAVYTSTGAAGNPTGTSNRGAEPTNNFALYVVAADLNQDGDVSDMVAGNSEKVAKLHFWAAAPAGLNVEAGTATATDIVSLRHFDPVNNALIGNGPIVYRYNSDTIFRLYTERTSGHPQLVEMIGGSARTTYPPTDANARWIGEAELERRLAAHIALTSGVQTRLDENHLDPLRVKMRVRQYNISGRPSANGTSFSVIDVFFWANTPLRDP